MYTSISKGLLRTVAAAAFVATTGFAFSAQAGECPADKRMPNARQSVDFKAVGVTDTTLGSIDLGKEKAKIKDRELRFRKIVIQPGGIVPWHSHDDRPALIFVAEGEIIEYASNCAGADRSQGRRDSRRNQRHVALVEKPRRRPGRPVRR